MVHHFSSAIGNVRGDLRNDYASVVIQQSLLKTLDTTGVCRRVASSPLSRRVAERRTSRCHDFSIGFLSFVKRAQLVRPFAPD